MLGFVCLMEPFGTFRRAPAIHALMTSAPNEISFYLLWCQHCTCIEWHGSIIMNVLHYFGYCERVA